MYSQSFLTTSVLGIGPLPMTASSSGERLSGFDNAEFSVEPAPYWLSLGEEVRIKYNSTDTRPSVEKYKRVGVTGATANDYRWKVDDPIAPHILHYDEAKPLRLFYNNTIEFTTDGNYSVPTAYIRFLRKPATVNVLSTPVVSCDLSEHTHDEVVSLAVQLALENVEQPRLQSYLQEVNTME